MCAHAPYPPIGDYALIGDCHGAALVSRAGAIDWCCLPRFDSGSCFGRLLDWERGGHCAIAPAAAGYTTSRRYVDDTLVLETTFRAADGEARLFDGFAMRPGGRERPHRQILRVIEGVCGRIALRLRVAPRFDYGALAPWLRRAGPRAFAAFGGNDALLVASDADLALDGRHDLVASFAIGAGERVRLSLQYVRPERLDRGYPGIPDAGELDRRLDETLGWWRGWAARARFTGPDAGGILRSALTLKALTYAPTGAIVAAPTTSLPEQPGGPRNWDYRYSWIRDSALSVRALAAVGYDAEAEAFARFIERSAAGAAASLQILYGVGGERRLTEIALDQLDDYRGARPVRVGNAAAGQLQLDAYGLLAGLAWDRHARGHRLDDDDWRFVVDLVDTAAARWREPDRGIWEVRGAPRHFVHSKALCWAALDRGLRLAAATGRVAPRARWTATRDAIRAAIEARGYDAGRGVFVQAFGARALDAATLLLPSVGFAAYDDPRMVRTIDALRADLDRDGLLLRYRADEADDGLPGGEGVFLPCTFWLAECLARQGRAGEARAAFDRALATANDLGLFAEEYDPRGGEPLGNFPQGLTHLSHLAAAVAIAALPEGAR